MAAVIDQSDPVSRFGVPSALAATTVPPITPAVPVTDRCWEPQALFLHDWSSSVRVSSAWQTVTARARTGAFQRNGLSDKPIVSTNSVTKCFRPEHWRVVKEVVTKQEVCRYLSPLHSDVCHGVTLIDPQQHRFSTTSSLSTRRLFIGQHAFIATMSDSSMLDEFTAQKVAEVTTSTNRFTLDGPLRRVQYEEPKIDTGIYEVIGDLPPGFNIFTTTLLNAPYGFASGVNVHMVTNWNPSTSRAIIGGNDGFMGAGVTMVMSKAQVALVKPGDQVIHIAYTMCKNSQTISLSPRHIRPASQNQAAPSISVQPTWDIIANWTESGASAGGSNGSSQSVNGTNPTTAQLMTTSVVVRRTTITEQMCNTLSQAPSGVNGRGECQVVVDGNIIHSGGSSGTTNNAILQAVIVVRDGFVTVVSGGASLIAEWAGRFMSHRHQDTPTGESNKLYPSGTAYPNLIQTITASSRAPKSKMVALQVMSYGITTVPQPVFSAPVATNAATTLYPTSVLAPGEVGGTSNPVINQVRALGTGGNDVLFRLHEIAEDREQDEFPADLSREFTFTSRFDAAQAAPTSAANVPFLFSVGLLLNPSVKKTLRAYPAIEADPSPAQPQVALMSNSTVGSVRMSAVQTSGRVAMYGADANNETTGWDYSAYPPFQSNAIKTSTCNQSSSYPTGFVTAPLLIGQFDYEATMTVGAGSSVKSEQFGIGRSIEGYSDKPYKMFEVSAKFLSRAKAWKFLEMWNNRRGRLLPVWFPSPANAVTIKGWTNNRLILDGDGDVMMSKDYGGKYLYIGGTDGSHYIVSVSGYEVGEQGVEAIVDTTLFPTGQQTCSLGTAVKNLVDAQRIRRATTVHLCFFDSDELEEEWVTDEVMTTSFQLVEELDFASSQSLNISVPTTSCGTVETGFIDDCAAAGGSYRGCRQTPLEEENGVGCDDSDLEDSTDCCFCFTNDIRLRLIVYCFDGCIPTGVDRDTPYECEGQCQVSGSRCGSTGETEYDIPLAAADSSCGYLRFTLPIAGNSNGCAGGTATFSLCMRTRLWSISSGALTNGCCTGCQCFDGVECCLSGNCFFACGSNYHTSECLTFRAYEQGCNAACQNPSCDQYDCGQNNFGNIRPLTNCCGGPDPDYPNIRGKGRLRFYGEIVNGDGSPLKPTNERLACRAPCTNCDDTVEGCPDGNSPPDDPPTGPTWT